MPVRHRLPGHDVVAGVYDLRGDIVEIGTDDLAMSDRRRCAPSGAGVNADAHDGDLIRRTEGWPAGLTSRCWRCAPAACRRRASVTGDDRFVGDYLRSEILDRVSHAEVAFTRTSILDRMCGGLCDAVVGRSGSGRTPRAAGEPQPLVVPLDRRREWYRFHRLFRALLHAELTGGTELPPAAAASERAVVRGERHAGAGHRARHGRGEGG